MSAAELVEDRDFVETDDAPEEAAAADNEEPAPAGDEDPDSGLELDAAALKAAYSKIARLINLAETRNERVFVPLNVRYGTPAECIAALQKAVADVKAATSVKRQQSGEVEFVLDGMNGSSVAVTVVFPASKRKRAVLESDETRPNGKAHLLFAHTSGGVPGAVQDGLRGDGARERALEAHFPGKAFQSDDKLIEALVGKAWSVALKDPAARRPWAEEAERCGYSRSAANWEALKNAVAACSELTEFIASFAGSI